MATFTWAPDYGASNTPETNTLASSFGGGYEQRAQVGMNPIKRVWPLTFTVSPADADAIEGFILARGIDLESFSWTPPTGATGKWRVRKNTLKRAVATWGNHVITVTFEELFEL